MVCICATTDGYNSGKEEEADSLIVSVITSSGRVCLERYTYTSGCIIVVPLDWWCNATNVLCGINLRTDILHVASSHIVSVQVSSTLLLLSPICRLDNIFWAITVGFFFFLLSAWLICIVLSWAQYCGITFCLSAVLVFIYPRPLCQVALPIIYRTDYLFIWTFLELYHVSMPVIGLDYNYC